MESVAATIISLQDGQATVSVDRVAVCARCAAGKGCGAGVFGSDRQPAKLEVAVPETLRLRVGDRVDLVLQPEDILRASLLAYGLPLMAVVAMLAIGYLLAAPLHEATEIALAAAGLLAGMFTSRFLLARNQCLQQFVPRILPVTGSLQGDR